MHPFCIGCHVGVYHNGHKKILGHTQVAPAMIGDQKQISITNPMMTKNFQ
jgi:hypothetical protein